MIRPKSSKKNVIFTVSGSIFRQVKWNLKRKAWHIFAQIRHAQWCQKLNRVEVNQEVTLEQRISYKWEKFHRITHTTSLLRLTSYLVTHACHIDFLHACVLNTDFLKNKYSLKLSRRFSQKSDLRAASKTIFFRVFAKSSREQSVWGCQSHPPANHKDVATQPHSPPPPGAIFYGRH